MYKFPPLWAVCAIGALSIVKGIDEEPIRVREVLDMPEFPLVHVAGVCDITAEGATCWDNQGRPFKSLSERITAFYLSQTFASLAIRPGVKNRWVAFERMDPAPKAVFQYSGFESGNTGGYVSGWRSGMMLEWARLDVLKEDTTAQMAINFHRILPPINIGLKKGESVVVGGARLTVADFGRLTKSKLTSTQRFNGPEMKYFISVDRSAIGQAEQTFNLPMMLDKGGQIIQRVAENGKPFPAVDGFPMSGNFAQISMLSTSATRVQFGTNVDLGQVAQLQFGQHQSRKVIFENLRLDPLPAGNDQ
jgi:hypothetical protein